MVVLEAMEGSKAFELLQYLTQSVVGMAAQMSQVQVLMGFQVSQEGRVELGQREEPGLREETLREKPPEAVQALEAREAPDHQEVEADPLQQVTSEMEATVHLELLVVWEPLDAQETMGQVESILALGQFPLAATAAAAVVAVGVEEKEARAVAAAAAGQEEEIHLLNQLQVEKVKLLDKAATGVRVAEGVMVAKEVEPLPLNAVIY